MISWKRWPTLSLSFVLLAAAAVTAAPQPPAAAPPPEDGSFGETSQVVAVEVPVNVTDREGRPVRGLTAADFEVWDEGEKQKITGFQVVDLDVLAPDAGPAAAPAPAPETELPMRRHFLLLFDLSFSTPTSVLKARQAAREFVLEALHPSDLVAVATFSLEQGPRLVMTFTPDRSQLASAIDTLGLRPLMEGGFRRDPLFFIVEKPSLNESQAEAHSRSDRAQELKAQRDQAAREYLKAISTMVDREERSFERSRISNFSKGLGAMARTLHAVRGRKQVVFFSEGFDSRLLLGRTELDDEEVAEENAAINLGANWRVDNDQRFGNTALQNDINAMLEEFRRADCVIQAVDIGGLRAEGGEGRRGGIGHEGLFYMANETGGELFKDTNNLGSQLERVLQRTSLTYLLTFERSDLKRDGAYRRLRVKAKLPPGARMAHRTGYYAPRPFKDMDPLEKSLLASDGIMNAAPRRDLDVDLLVAPFRASASMSYVPVIIEVPGRKLLEGHTGDKLNVEFYGYVNDSLGEMKDYFTEIVGLDVKKGRQALMQAGLKYYGHFDLPPGDYRVRILVRNADTGRTVVTMMPVSVPTYDKSQPVLLPPFFMEEKRSWVLVREGTQQGRASVVYPFTVNGEPYVPAAKPELSPEEAARLCLVAYNFGSGDLSLQGSVTAADGKELPGGKVSLLERTTTGLTGVDKLLVRFEPTGLAAGEYVLRVAVTDAATGRREVNSMPFEVVQR